ncbi:MAG: hypothetical protein KH221_00865 [Atopobium sp.]|nr:hypothetical protein [Atopobium sp.]
MPKIAKESVDLPDFAKESVAQIQILCTFQARAAKGRRVWRETRALVPAPGEKPVRSQRMKYRVEHGGRGAPLTESYFSLRGPSPQNLHN